MNFNLEFSMISVVISLVVRLIAGFTFLLFIIPLQVKEAGVKNGLRKLRIQLLISGILLFLLNTIGMILLPARYTLSPDQFRVISETLAIFNSFAFLIVAWIKYQIYHTQYSPDSKSMHEKFEHSETETQITVKTKSKKG